MASLNRLVLMGALVLVSACFAETTCTKGDCELAITLKLAFQGASDQYMNDTKNEIESVWNGPNGFRTVGDCKCRMTFTVVTDKAADCKNNPPQGYHCIMVTPYFNASGQYDNPPRNQTNISGAAVYLGYMYGIARGNGNNSQLGWWSDQMSRPVNASQPQGEHYKDFAHEAGHMMGLNDSEGGIMSVTSGPNSQPTQQNLDDIAERICGADACPDRCCCGNGQVEKDKGEVCDPKAQPTGCAAGSSCCPVCCSCYGKVCVAANGEYFSLGDCQAACGTGSSCYMNYRTGCWDCLKQNVVVSGTCRDPSAIRGNLDCDHPGRRLVDDIVSFYEGGMVYAPVLGGALANERINVMTREGDTGHVVTRDGAVAEYGEGLLPDPSVLVATDRETVQMMASREMTAQQALSTGRVSIGGGDMLSAIKFGFFGLAYAINDILMPPPEWAPPEVDTGMPQEYFDAMDELEGNEAPDLPAGMPPDTTDDGYFGGDAFPG